MSNDHTPTVLVTSGGGVTRGAIHALTSLSDRDYEVVTVSSEPAAPELYAADVGCVTPPVADPEWPDALASVCERHGVDVIVPLIDERYVPTRLASLREQLRDAVEVVVGDPELIELTVDKYRMAETFADEGLPVPDSYLCAAADRVPRDAFPVVVKPRSGESNVIGDGVEVCEDREELEAHVSTLEGPLDEFVIQEFVPGTEYTTSVVVTASNDLLAVVPKEAVSDSPYHRVTREAPEVVAACEAVHEFLAPHSVINVQQIVSPRGLLTIEINARFSRSSCLTAAAGVNSFDLLVRDRLGERVDPVAEYEPDLHMLERTTPEFVADGRLRSRPNRDR
jgi:carbamoyl-phosphate synthase large subunit